MYIDYVLTLNSNDKPGVIETVSSVVNKHGANWLESRLAHLAGKFVGIIRVQVEQRFEQALLNDLKALHSLSIFVHADRVHSEHASASSSNARFSAIGPDRKGIVREIAKALVRQGINIEELETNLSSMPYSGEPVFEAHGLLSVPSDIDIKDLYEKMDAIANELGMDLDVEPLEPRRAVAASA